MPSATSRTSAFTASHRLATALMNEIFVARNTFDAYLIISADAESVTRIGACRLRYSSDTRTATAASLQPMTTRSGGGSRGPRCLRGGTRGSTPRRRPAGTPASLSSRSTSAVEPTGTVDLLTTTEPGRSTGAISRSGVLDEREVGRAVVALGRRHAEEHELGPEPRSPRPRRTEAAGGQPLGDELGEALLEDGHLALLKPRTFSASMSAQTTSWPRWARHAAVVRPT